MYARQVPPDRGGRHAEPPALPAVDTFFPHAPTTLEETGIETAFLADLAIRILYQHTELTGTAIAEKMALSFYGVVERLLEMLRHDREIEVKGQRGIGDAGYVYSIVEKGVEHARASLDRLGYTGPAPVPLARYVEAVLAQAGGSVVTEENIRRGFADLVLTGDILDMIGPAVNSGASVFLFGAPGNGKTAIAERITRLMGDSIFVPHAVDADGALITVFDAINHRPVAERGRAGEPIKPNWDARWVRIERPIVMVGGELTMSSLDLRYNRIGKYYEAPLQMKANDGMFLIDDFGRQMIRPQDLLNRWIVPLEKRVDFLNLLTGKKLAIPFEELIVFSTNLDPADLVDEAFLRRIKFKINVADPDEEQFRTIFRLVCGQRGVVFDEVAFIYLLNTWYRHTGRPLRMCHPRDIVDQLIAIAKYRMVPAELSRELIDAACRSYFVTVAGLKEASVSTRSAWAA